jgi:hypothetical protein
MALFLSATDGKPAVKLEGTVLLDVPFFIRCCRSNQRFYIQVELSFGGIPLKSLSMCESNFKMSADHSNEELTLPKR